MIILIFVFGMIAGGSIATFIMCCMQINRINSNEKSKQFTNQVIK